MARQRWDSRRGPHRSRRHARPPEPMLRMIVDCPMWLGPTAGWWAVVYVERHGFAAARRADQQDVVAAAGGDAPTPARPDLPRGGEGVRPLGRLLAADVGEVQ
jgi:hypothetical protein